MKAFTKLFLAVALMVCFFASNDASASHFRYGHLTYVKSPLSNSTVIFTLTNAFNRAAFGNPNVGDEITENVGATSLAFGDGSFTPTLHYRVIAIDIPGNYFIARALEVGDTSKQTLTHTYTAPGPFLAEINSCCRTGAEINNPNQNYRVSTIVDITNNNNSPVSSLPVIVNLIQGPASQFSVPAIDPDPNTFLKWRLATPAEMGSATLQNPPSAGGNPLSINSGTGLCTWNTTGAVLGGLYSCQVIIEDRAANDTSIIKTRVGVDFLIRILPQCPNPNLPVFIAPTPTCGSTMNGAPNVNITFTVQASDADPGNIVLNAAGLPAGSTMNPVLPTAGNPVSSIFSWTPTNAQIGAHVVAFIATDSCGAQTICNISFDIALPVELASFTSVVSGNDVTLNWATSSEVNNSRFEIERSANGTEWATTGTVAGNGNSTTPISYSYTDKGLAIGSYSYRLKQIDFNGNYEYHALNNEVVIGAPTKFNLMQNYPNPFNPVTKIDFEIPTDGHVNLYVYDNSGKLVSTLTNGFKTAGYYTEIFSASNIASGVYYYKLEYSSNNQSFEKVMKMVVLK